ncbi:MAG: hypothetical protein HQL26_04780 [Candidatus Omnitrophica bacterium]|nr:hypothetical protein [Candidatus Omnitrophota bacterium]
MSIINDALKKTQNVMQKNTQTNQPTEQPNPVGNDQSFISPLPIEPNNENHGIMIKILVGVCLVLLCITVYNTVAINHKSKNLTQKSPSPVTASKVSTQAITALPTASVPPIVHTAPPTQAPTFVISGIMSTGTKKVALINGEVYETGAEIDGYTIQSIDLQSVKLVKDGVELTLKVAK